MKKVFLAVAAVAAITLSSCGGNTSKSAVATDSVAEQADSTVAGSATALSDETNQTITTLTDQATQALQSKDAKTLTTTLATLQATYKALVNAGKLDEAKAYGQSIKHFLAQNAESIKTVTNGDATIASLVEGIQNLPTTAATTAEEAKQAVKDDAVKLAAPYIQKAASAAATAEAASAALKAAPEAAKKIVEAAPAAAKEAAKTAATNAVNNAKTAATNAKTAAENKAAAEVNKAEAKAAEKVTKAQNKAADKVREGQKKANDKVNEAANKALKGLGL